MLLSRFLVTLQYNDLIRAVPMFDPDLGRAKVGPITKLQSLCRLVNLISYTKW